MSKNSLKKILLFHSEREKDIIDHVSEDLSIVNKSSISYEIRTALVRGLFPDNGFASFNLQHLYAGDKSLKDSVAAVYSYLAAEIGGKRSKYYENALPLIQFSKEMCVLASCDIVTSHQHVHYFKQNWDVLCDDLERALSNERNYRIELLYQIPQLRIELVKAKKLSDKLQTRIAAVSPSEVFDFIINAWIVLKRFPSTYRVLFAITSIVSSWPEYAEARVEYMGILTSITRTWPRDEKKEEKNAQMRQIRIKDGILIIPDSWIILNPDDALKSTYAHHFWVKGNAYTREKFSPFPEFVYLDNSWTTKENNNKAICLIEEIWTPAKAIQAIHIAQPDNLMELEPCVREAIMDSSEIIGEPIWDDSIDINHPGGAKIIRKK